MIMNVISTYKVADKCFKAEKDKGNLIGWYVSNRRVPGVEVSLKLFAVGRET